MKLWKRQASPEQMVRIKPPDRKRRVPPGHDRRQDSGRDLQPQCPRCGYLIHKGGKHTAR